MQPNSLKKKTGNAPPLRGHHKPQATDTEGTKKKTKIKSSTIHEDTFSSSGECAPRKNDTRLPGEVILKGKNIFLVQPISKQPEKIRALMMQASDKHFCNFVPYVFALKEHSRVSLLPDLSSTVQRMHDATEQIKGTENALGDVWRQMADGWQFFAFTDRESQAIRIGTIDGLKKEKIFGDSILGDLFLTGEDFDHNESRALYKELTENGILSRALTSFLEKAEKSVGPDAQRWGAEELLISASADGCIFLVESLLKKNVSPNAFSSATGHHAINAVKEGSEAYKLLLAYGADTEAKAEDPHC